MAHLTADLSAMGLDPEALETLPLCAAAARLAGTREAAVGALYVMEGSTLGGQVISKALAGADWLPTGGLAYFNPYADRTGAMWRSFRDWAQMTTPIETHAEVAAGAVSAFETLHGWMAEERA
jgi:heme oxygenase